MRLAFCVRAIYPQHGIGGLERAATAQIRHLLAQDVDVALYTQPLSEPFLRAGEPGTLAVRAVTYGGLPLRPNGIPARLTNYKSFVERMGRAVRPPAYMGRFHGAYAHGLCAWGLRRASEWGLPLIANPHGLEEFKVSDPLKRLAYTPFRAWVRAGCRAADRVIATDHAMRGEVARLLGIDPAKVAVVPSGVDPSEIGVYISDAEQTKIISQWPLLEPNRARFVGISVGRMEANKGFGDLISALHSAAPHLGDSWAWVFVGDGSLRQSLLSQASSLGLSDHLIFTGSVSDPTLHNLYARADLFAHPSLFEGSSLVTLEAMSHALPVVATRVGGIPDKIREGETGFLVDPANPEQLAERITLLARDPEKRRDMGRMGANRVAAEFSWPRSMSLLVDLFREVLNEKIACREVSPK